MLTIDMFFKVIKYETKYPARYDVAGHLLGVPPKPAECEHDWEWVDTSFDHEYGTEMQGYYGCQACGEIGSTEYAEDYE